MCLGTIVPGHNRVWAQSYLGTIVSWHNRVWAQSCLGTVVWAQSCMGTNMVEPLGSVPKNDEKRIQDEKGFYQGHAQLEYFLYF